MAHKVGGDWRKNQEISKVTLRDFMEFKSVENREINKPNMAKTLNPNLQRLVQHYLVF